jgi:uncharacterized hydrophobic protein (TIGR00271 family)
MRQLIVKVPRGQGEQALQIANKHKGQNLASFEAHDQEKDWDLVLGYFSNDQIGRLLKDLESLQELHITLFPHSVFPMSPPSKNVPEEIKTVNPRSPLEVWLNGIQSIGSWKGFLGYALAAGIVVWIGMFTNTIYLLVAAMLIAPFAGPAMNTAIATASGDTTLLGRNILRYFVALTLTIATTAAISLLLGQETATATMVSVSELSSVAFLLPLVAGAAGALNLVQAQNSSLVSGTAVGILIAASLTPPAGLIGMSAAIGRWDMVKEGIFVLLLQLACINLTGSLLFRAFGLNTSGERYQRGRPSVFYVSLVISAAALAGLLWWQFSSRPNLQRSTISERAVSKVAQVVDQSHLADLVEANMHFTRASVSNQNTLLGVIYVQRKQGVQVPAEQIRQQLTMDIQKSINQQGFHVTPLVDIIVLEPSPSQ